MTFSNDFSPTPLSPSWFRAERDRAQLTQQLKDYVRANTAQRLAKFEGVHVFADRIIKLPTVMGTANGNTEPERTSRRRCHRRRGYRGRDIQPIHLDPGRGAGLARVAEENRHPRSVADRHRSDFRVDDQGGGHELRRGQEVRHRTHRVTESTARGYYRVHTPRTPAPRGLGELAELLTGPRLFMRIPGPTHDPRR